MATTLDWEEMGESQHFVQFYETDAFLLDSLSEFIGTGLRAGDGCIVLATKAHRESLEEKLKGDGLEDAVAPGQYASIDADAALPLFMVDGSPEPELFTEVVRSMIARVGNGHRPVRIFGELVALLWA